MLRLLKPRKFQYNVVWHCERTGNGVFLLLYQIYRLPRASNTDYSFGRTVSVFTDSGVYFQIDPTISLLTVVNTITVFLIITTSCGAVW